MCVRNLIITQYEWCLLVNVVSYRVVRCRVCARVRERVRVRVRVRACFCVLCLILWGMYTR